MCYSYLTFAQLTVLIQNGVCEQRRVYSGHNASAVSPVFTASHKNAGF